MPVSIDDVVFISSFNHRHVMAMSSTPIHTAKSKTLWQILSSAVRFVHGGCRFGIHYRVAQQGSPTSSVLFLTLSPVRSGCRISIKSSLHTIMDSLIRFNFYTIVSAILTSLAAAGTFYSPHSGQTLHVGQVCTLKALHSSTTLTLLSSRLSIFPEIARYCLRNIPTVYRFSSPLERSLQRDVRLVLSRA
ncbi:hypothetical protein CPB85DRAFT_886221 [Mucidula mucida]|nr:hypothetical protein CPB85DRAFT_886221 [Mucidula mucida]